MAAEDMNPSALDAALDAKNLGNACFREGNWKGAIKHYKAAFLASHSIRSRNETTAMYGSSTPISPEEKVAEESFSAVLYSNMAATYLKLEQGDKAVKYAKLGVEAAGASVPAKLLLRLGKAYYMKGDLFNAEAVLKNAAKQNSTGSEMRAVASVLQQVQAACKQQDMKLGAKLAAAFK